MSGSCKRNPLYRTFFSLQGVSGTDPLPSLFAPAAVDNRTVNLTVSVDSSRGVRTLSTMPTPRKSGRRVSHGHTSNPRIFDLSLEDAARIVKAQIAARETAAVQLADQAREALPRVINFALGLSAPGDSVTLLTIDLVADACGAPTRRGDATAVLLDAARARLALEHGAPRLTAREVAALSGRARPTIVQVLGNRILREAALAYIAASPMALPPWRSVQPDDIAVGAMSTDGFGAASESSS